jgi:hypothetical protein
MELSFEQYAREENPFEGGGTKVPCPRRTTRLDLLNRATVGPSNFPLIIPAVNIRRPEEPNE